MPGIPSKVPSAQRTTSGNSGSLQVGPGNSGGWQKVSLLVDVTAVGANANETLDLDIEWSTDGVTFAAGETADSFAQLTQPGGVQTVAKQFNVMGSYYRVVWTLAGTTPDFTFSIDEYVS